MFYHLTRSALVVFLMILCTTAMAQERTVTGTVRDAETREPLVGVTVGIKGNNRTAITNERGEFSIDVASAESVLKFSYVGFVYYETQVKENSTFTIALAKDDKSMDEVVIVGYGTQKKATVTGAINQINAKELEDLPLTNLGATLVGRFPGVGVSGGTSRPGSNAIITIRNPFLLSKDGGTLSPLYVIDDVIRTEDDFNLLDPSEVEDISILKDAAAAIYGARSSQGVVLVRTKRGKAGKIQIGVNSSYAINDATMLPSMMNGYQHARYLNAYTQAERGFVADGTNGYLAQQKYYTDDELEHFRNNNTDWLRMAWKPSHMRRHALNLSGGTERATFFAGASYVKQDGNLDRINLEKWTFRASGDVKLANGFKASLSVSGDLNTREQYLLKQGGENPENDVKGLLYTPGFTPAYINGYPVRLSLAGNQNTIDAFHFFEVQRLNNYNNSKDNGLNIVSSLEYQMPFIRGLSARVQYGKSFDNSYPKQFGTRYKLYQFEMTGGHNHIYTDRLLTGVQPVSVTNGNRIYLKPSFAESYQLNAQIAYNRKVGKHDIAAIAIVEQSESMYSDIQAITEDPTEGAPDNNRFAFGVEDAFETQRESGNLGYIGRLNYGFNNKYLAEFAFRYDGSTNFPEDNRFGFFYSTSVGWIISEESFFEGAFFKPFNFLKLRASYGHLGSDATRPYSYLQRYTPLATGGPVFGGNNSRVVGTRAEALPNPGIGWDDAYKFNAGLDARFLNNRLSTTIDGFYDRRVNMLTAINASIPLLVGSAVGSENYSAISGYGIEFSAGWRDNIGKDFQYNLNTFLVWSDAKSVKVDVEKGKIGTFEDPIGKSTDMGVLGYHYLGMFRTQQEVDDYLSKNPGYKIFGQVPKPGMLYYRDVRGPKNATTNEYAGPDGIIDENDEDWIAPKSSNHYGFGFNTGIGFKGFKLDVIMSGSFGGQGSVEGAARKVGTATSSRPDFWTDVWTPDNPNAAYPNPYYTSTYDVMSSFWFKSSFNFRMRNASLSYALPPSLTKGIGVNNIKVYINVVNPVNFYNPYDYKDNALGSFDAYPNLRTFAFGINATL